MIGAAPSPVPPVGRTVDEPRAALAEWDAAWHSAARANPGAVHESFYEFGGRPVRLRVVGERLAQQTRRTFAHLERRDGGPAPPALRIDLWDEADAGVPVPRDLVRDPAAFNAPIGSGVATIREGGRLIGFERSTSITWLDRAAGHIVGWRASGERLSLDERSKPIPLALRIWYYDQDIDIIHAGLVATGEAGVLIGGPSGAGKSTTVLSCLAAGFAFLGDDEIGLARRADGSYVGHSLYNSARSPHPLPDERAASLSQPDGEKPLRFIAELHPERVRRCVPIRALVLPRVAATRESRLHTLSRTEALLRLGATALVTPLGLGTRAFDRLADLVARVPRYSLELGRDPEGIPRCVEQAWGGTST